MVYSLTFSWFYSELQRKAKAEDKNVAVSANKAKVETSSLKQSKQDLGKEPSSTEQDNSEIQHEGNNSKCMKTETVSAAEGKSSEESSEGQESSNNATKNEQDVSKDVPVQKKRKRCWTCNAKLELAQRELGNCRCSKYCYFETSFESGSFLYSDNLYKGIFTRYQHCVFPPRGETFEGS